MRALDPRIHSLLDPFLEQSVIIGSMVAIGCGEVLVGENIYNAATADKLEEIAAQARERSGSEEILFVLPLDLLNAHLAESSGFRALAVLLPTPPQDGDWRLRRTLFDRGLICVGSVPLAESKALCFLASDAVQSLNTLVVEPRGHISMRHLSDGGGFANQLFRYSTLKLYALRHGLAPAVPDWTGHHLFGLNDESSQGLDLPQRTYAGFADNDRELWDWDVPPIDIDLAGYFQELPECWRLHRPLLQRMFELAPEHRTALDAWHDAVTDGGRRTLVAIHVRRGDYRTHQSEGFPWIRLVPERWYLDWLRSLWPTLHDPVLYVATDEPEAILPIFREFNPISLDHGGPVLELPGFVRDFEVLKRAGHLALCNSSYSRMAAILAPATQRCFLPSFRTQSFAPYEPWIDPAFWTRFADSWSVQPRPASTHPVRTPVIYFDVSDLVLDLFHNSTLSGIQRFQSEILRGLAAENVRCTVLSKRGGLFTIELTELLRIIEDLRTESTSRDLAKRALDNLLNAAIPCTLSTGDIFLETGAFWNVPRIGPLLRSLNASGVRIGIFIHDILPIVAPEYFEEASTSAFVKGLFEALTFAHFVLTTSEFNRTCLKERMPSACDRLPVRLVPLGSELSAPAYDPPSLSETVAELLEQNYVLAVGTIEVRKNPSYLLNMWKIMVRSGRPDVPRLVFVGRMGWMVEDFMRQLRGCNYLGGRIVVLNDTTDVELDLLYRNCLLTAFPSFLEGWGLPVGESLGHGKICLCSASGGTAGVGGDLLDYIDPYNVRDGLEKLLRYLDDPERRVRREQEIAGKFEPRAWRRVAENVLETILSLSHEPSSDTSAAIIRLPDDRFLPISSDPHAVPMDQVDGRLSAELACVSGWHPPELAGIRAAEPEARIQFRATLPAGSKINLVLRLTACFGHARIRILTGSGSAADVELTAGLEKMAVLSCAVEEGQLVTVNLLSIGAAITAYAAPGAVWLLSGLLYFDPTRAAAPQARYPARQPDPVLVDRIHLRPVAVDRSRRVESLDAFLETPDSYWPFESTAVRRPPMFASEADAEAFVSGCGDRAKAPQLGAVRDSINFVRRTRPFVSTSRFSEGSVFDRHGVWRGSGYLLSAPEPHTQWRSESSHGFEVDRKLVAEAPFYQGTYLNFYNGNLHNYYHWLVEGLLSLDILTGALGSDPNLKILLPKSMDIAALIDHRGSLSDIGLGDREVIEVAADFVAVEEAVWVEPDLVETVPAAYLKNFRRRIAALYATAQTGHGRRLLVARRGPTRTIQNLDQVQDCLSKYGFETVYVEGMSMRDQILLFQSAAFIVAAHGAALSNLLWCAPGTKVLEFMPTAEMRPFFWLISQKLDLVHAMQFCQTVEASQFQSAIHVDIAKLDVLLSKLEA
jgi:hypothetical protein